MSSNTVVNTVIFMGIVVIVVLIIFNYINVNNNYNMPALVPSIDVSKCNCENKHNHTPQSIVKINSTQNETMSNGSKPTLTLYYTDWCGYSRMFLPEWEKIKNSEISGLVNFEEYECDKNSQKCKENNIHGYPSLLFHKNDGTKVAFPDNKQRNLDGVISFVKSNV